MSEEATITIHVYERDAHRLIDMFGKPIRNAIRQAIGRAPCPHPETKRTYLSAVIPAEGEDAINLDSGPRTVHGFHCAVCCRYVFPDARGE